jgi:hypothetical protein
VPAKGYLAWNRFVGARQTVFERTGNAKGIWCVEKRDAPYLRSRLRPSTLLSKEGSVRGFSGEFKNDTARRTAD